mgnify:CR=1 FL=1
MATTKHYQRRPNNGAVQFFILENINTMTNSILQSNAMLASVNISCAGFVRKDRKVTDQVNKDHAASSNAGKYDKNLFDPKETDGPQRVARAARTTHERLTLRWGKQSLLTVAMKQWNSTNATLNNRLPI